MSDKTLKIAVFAVVENSEGEVLAVKRPEGDEDLPGVWGLPATSVEEYECIEDGFERIGTEKLGVKLEKKEFVGRSTTERENYVLVGEEHHCIISGEPRVDRDAPGTQYTDCKWAEPEIFRKAAKEGSLCCQIFLENKNIEF